MGENRKTKSTFFNTSVSSLETLFPSLVSKLWGWRVALVHWNVYFVPHEHWEGQPGFRQTTPSTSPPLTISRQEYSRRNETDAVNGERTWHTPTMILTLRAVGKVVFWVISPGICQPASRLVSRVHPQGHCHSLAPSPPTLSSWSWSSPIPSKVHWAVSVEQVLNSDGVRKNNGSQTLT